MIKSCRYCAEEIHVNAVKCKHCGRNQKISGLTIFGYIWVAFGVLNIIIMVVSPRYSSDLAAVGLLFNGILFVIPGLIVAHVGKR